MSESIRFRCANCNGEAAEIGLRLDRGSGSAELWRTGFWGKPTLFGPAADLMEFFARLSGGDLIGQSAQEAEFLGFVCRTCRQVYCESCWTNLGARFDEGFYDYSEARCPKGHEQIVDD